MEKELMFSHNHTTCIIWVENLLGRPLLASEVQAIPVIYWDAFVRLLDDYNDSTQDMEFRDTVVFDSVKALFFNHIQRQNGDPGFAPVRIEKLYPEMFCNESI